MVQKSSRGTTMLLVVALAVSSFGAGYGFAQRTAAAAPTDEQGFALLRELLATVRREYLHPIPESSKLFDGAARGMLEALGDPYTRYMDRKAFRDFSQDTQGYFYGIGIFIDIRDSHLIVVQPIEGTPAQRAGLRAGDRIRMIDTAPTDGMAIQEAVSRIRGPAGTKVTLTISRGTQTFQVQITRARVQIVTVQGPGVLEPAVQRQLAADRLGYVRILTFNEQTAKEVAAEVDRQIRGGARGLVIDLRSNGGGLLESSLQIANRFIADGRAILHIVGRDGRRTTERAGRGAKVTVPVVVLVNEFSASASEILAGALKDSAGATLVGQRTFGKGVIQSVFSFSGGGGAAITTQKYLTPSEHDIHAKGIPPDVVAGDKLEGKSEADVTRIQHEQLQRGIQILKQRVTRQ
ncbi:MAG: S41 family peptidase [Armatimonadota bacterium]|nr:S41 family peptidase [Armatimonadota bacterium]